VSRQSGKMFYDLRGQGGFTLVELLVVIAIIAILASIAVPLFLGQRTKAMRGEAMTNLEAIRLLQEQYYAENGVYAPSAGGTLGDCDFDKPGNVDTIRGELPGFKPGTGTELLFSYCIVQNKALKTDDLTTLIDNSPCFTARAYGNSGYAIEGQLLSVDCLNNKNY
jgi:prepilin-type N-terminal cleavage/methylation domain-containing protein